MTNWEAYFGTPDRATVTLVDFLYHSQKSGILDEGSKPPTFDVTAECTMPTLSISGVNPGASISDWMNTEVRDD